MSLTYYVALPFVQHDTGLAPRSADRIYQFTCVSEKGLTVTTSELRFSVHTHLASNKI